MIEFGSGNAKKSTLLVIRYLLLVQSCRVCRWQNEEVERLRRWEVVKSEKRHRCFLPILRINDLTKLNDPNQSTIQKFNDLTKLNYLTI